MKHWAHQDNKKPTVKSMSSIYKLLLFYCQILCKGRGQGWAWIHAWRRKVVRLENKSLCLLLFCWGYTYKCLLSHGFGNHILWMHLPFGFQRVDFILTRTGQASNNIYSLLFSTDLAIFMHHQVKHKMRGFAFLFYF